MKHPFIVGGYYRDRVQGYEVVSMTDRGMVVQYDDGTRAEIARGAMDIKARIHNNIQAEFHTNHPISTDQYFRSIGFLSGNSRFDAELPNHVVSNFLEHYNSLTGDTVSVSHPNVILLGDVDKYGAELRIYFPSKHPKLDFGPGIDVRAGQTDGIERINNNALWFKLVGLGFRLGKDHDRESIRGSVPHDKREFFDEGLESD